ncbi:hypothetical protein UFOVP49_84 [uncultured Caudovirales phage]|uniref:Uncharacterized protein n=1 Tax=uncultured Caudovirales phage TaxID=2100421 RepID=A0A6J5KSN8_9CAUD|nr:hypothetical protein UFOVP49_84 [uncultured Caudovirales phage]
MIPGDSLSSVPVYAEYLYGDSLSISKIRDYEMGGIALNDASQGLNTTLWRLDISGTHIVISENGANPINIITGTGITEASFAFDQNMRIVVTYVQNDQAKLYWYDSTISGITTTILDAAVKSPRVAMDDKRSQPTNQGETDVILAYVRNNNLYFRMQRERYEVEHLLYSTLNGVLVNMGMNKTNRLQFQIQP